MNASPDPPGSRAAPTTDRGRRRREAVLDAAAELFLEHGFHGTSVDDLGAAAGISGPGLYRHFASKDDLLMAVLDRLWEQLRPAIDQARTSAPDEALRLLLDAHLELALAQPAALVLLVQELRHLPEDYRRLAARNHARYVDAWVDVLRRSAPHVGESRARAAVLAAHGVIDSAAINPAARTLGTNGDLLREMATAVLDRARASERSAT